MKTISELAVRWFERHPDALTRSQRRVLEASAAGQPVARNPNDTFEGRSSFGDRLADAMVAPSGAVRGRSSRFFVSARRNGRIVVRQMIDDRGRVASRHILSSSASRPFRMSIGGGGHPGTCRSTGSTSATPFMTA